MPRPTFACAAALLTTLPLAAQSSTVTTRRPSAAVVEVRAESSALLVTIDVAWPNSWRNARNHDAAWLIVREASAERALVRLDPDREAACTGSVEGEVVVSPDGIGAFVQPADEHRGNAAFRVTLTLEEPVEGPLSAHAVGMVFIPGGPFEAGDDDETARRFGALHGVDEAGQPTGPLRIRDEGELRIAPKSAGLGRTLDYAEGRYFGDRAGSLPTAWPKGTRAFYVMKHELTQGSYAAWLSALPRGWQERRAPLDLRGKETDTCTISRTADGFVAAVPSRPCNFVSWDDSAAWLDWHGLRPMTELEFEKAARGPERPMPLDYPWGTAALEDTQRRVTKSRDLDESSDAAESRLSDATRARLGASHFWVMDLSGSLWERVISLGHPRGRAFVGSHGDGNLDADGNATNPDWPRGSEDGKEAPGIGYRGGAEYFAGIDPRNPTNPCSPVALRTYGGWAGAERYKTYSARGVRTAPPHSE